MADNRAATICAIGMGKLAAGGTRGTKTVAEVEQLDLLDDQHAIIITRDDTGIANLQAVTLP